jgi:colicin import membrane protein
MPGVIQRWRPYLLSVALHAALVIIIVVLGMDAWRSSPPAPQALAIEAVTVDAKEFARMSRVEPEATPMPVPEPPPDAAAVEAARQQQVERERQAERVAAEQTQRKAESERKAQLARKAEADRRAAAERKIEAERKAEADRKAVAERLARELQAEERRRADDVRIRAEREAALQRDLAAEVVAAEAAAAKRAAAARAATLAAQWAAAIQGRVQRAWIRPPSAGPGLDCRVLVTQAPGGSVIRAEVRSCNGDDAVRQSIEAAVFRASPLPPPPDPDLFERIIELRFRPND